MAVTEQVTILLKAKDQASHVIDGVTGKMGGLSKLALGATAATAAAATAMVAGLTKVVSDGVGKAMEMEQRVADIASVMGMAANDVAPLQDLIANLGLDPTLKVNATEAADAIEMLAKNGLSMTEILDGAARATVLLANSTGGDFSVAADVATDAMAQFGIDAANMQDAVNQITGVTVNSKFTINDYALALAQAGGVASGVGVDFEDFNAVIAAISPLFASGSDAGTSFKTMLQRLIPQSNDATDAMRALGLFTGLTTEEYAKTEEKLAKVNAEIAALDPTTDGYADKLAKLQTEQALLNSTLVEGQNAFFNADGSMKSMTEIAGILQRATAGLSEEQKNQMISTIFGTDAMRAAFGLMNAGEADVLALKDKIGDVSAEESAATRMGTLKGALEILGGQYDALTTRIGEAFLPMVRTMVDRFVELTDTYGPNVVQAFEGIAGGIEQFMVKWGEYWPKLSQILFDEKTGIVASIQDIMDSVTEFAAFISGGGNGADFSWIDFWVKVAQSTTLAIKSMLEGIADLMQSFSLMGQAVDALRAGDWGKAGELAQQIGGKLGNALYQGTIFSAIDRGKQINEMWEGRAAGGPVRGNRPYWVGERGPELFVPQGSGHIVPNSQVDNRRVFTVENLNIMGGGNAADDVLSSVQLLTALYG